MDLVDLETPCLLLDRRQTQRNVDRLRTRLAEHNVPLRPHVKTAKCEPVVAMMLVGQPGGITVSTVAEAEYFFARGHRDLTYAVGIGEPKLLRLANLIRAGAMLRVLVDTPGQVDMLVRAATQLDVVFPALVEIDCDGQRAGLRPGDDRLPGLARALVDNPHTSFAGVLTHAGGSYHETSSPGIAEVAARERDAVVTAATRLRTHGMAVETVSVGSTPTATFGHSFEGVTEVRAGVYVFGDLVMVGLGVCSWTDISLSVLCTVIGHQLDRNWLLVDAGWTALSRDRGTAEQAVDCGYGLVCDRHGQLIDGLWVINTSQEHGVLAMRDHTMDFSRFPVGTRLRILPNHACATAAAHDGYHVVDGPGTVVEQYWPRCGGW